MEKDKIIELLKQLQICLKYNSIENAQELIQIEIDNLNGANEKKCQNTKYYFYDNYCQYCGNLNCNSNKKNKERGDKMEPLQLLGVSAIFILIGIGGIYLVLKSNEKEEIAERQRVSSLSTEEQKKYFDDKTIDYTIIVSEDSKKSLGSAVARGAVGGAILGPVGLVGGAVSAKNKSKTTFTVVYKSGRREVVTVDNDSYEFKNYAKYVR